MKVSNGPCDLMAVKVSYGPCDLMANDLHSWIHIDSTQDSIKELAT